MKRELVLILLVFYEPDPGFELSAIEAEGCASSSYGKDVIPFVRRGLGPDSHIVLAEHCRRPRGQLFGS